MDEKIQEEQEVKSVEEVKATIEDIDSLVMDDNLDDTVFE